MNLKKAVLSALAYHSIFNYPLTFEEIYKFTEVKTNKKKLSEALLELRKSEKIFKITDFYSLTKSEKFTFLRKKRQAISKQKMKKASVFVNILSTIPTIKLVAITGALSLKNSDENDDIDLLIIASNNRIWTSRFFANLLLFPYKRSPRSNKQKDKACLNIFLDESKLRIENKNLYIAHEIAQMKVVLNTDNTYEKFIKENHWVYDFLPNWIPEKVSSKNKYSFNFPIELSIFTNKVEDVLKKYQLNYMKEKVSSEKITDKQLFFHPKQTNQKIMKEYREKVSTIGCIDS